MSNYENLLKRREGRPQNEGKIVLPSAFEAPVLRACLSRFLVAVPSRKLLAETLDLEHRERERELREKKAKEQREARDKELREREGEETKEREDEMKMFKDEQKSRDQDRILLLQQQKHREKEHVTHVHKSEDDHVKFTKERRIQRDKIHRQREDQEISKNKEHDKKVRTILGILQKQATPNVATSSETFVKVAEAMYKQNRKFVESCKVFVEGSRAPAEVPADWEILEYNRFLEKLASFTEPKLIFGVTTSGNSDGEDVYDEKDDKVRHCFVILCFKEKFWMIHSKKSTSSVSSISSVRLSRLDYNSPMTIGRVKKETHVGRKVYMCTF